MIKETERRNVVTIKKVLSKERIPIEGGKIIG